MLPPRNVLICLGLVAFVASPARAARYVSLEVEQDGKVVLEGGTGDNGSPGAFEVWNYLKERPVEPVAGFVLEVDPDRPLEATLRGNLRVKVRYGGDVPASELKLTRRQPGSTQWFLDTAWIDSHAPPPDPAQVHAAAVRADLRELGVLVGRVCLGALILAAVVLIWVLFRKRASRERSHGDSAEVG
jgi:hypothetical protein